MTWAENQFLADQMTHSGNSHVFNRRSKTIPLRHLIDQTKNDASLIRMTWAKEPISSCPNDAFKQQPRVQSIPLRHLIDQTKNDAQEKVRMIRRRPETNRNRLPLRYFEAMTYSSNSHLLNRRSKTIPLRHLVETSPVLSPDSFMKFEIR
jgi:hypothetical protein